LTTPVLPILVLAREGAARREVCDALGSGYDLREAAPEALAELAPWVDVVACVCVLDGAPDESAWLERLGELGAGSALVLLVDPQTPDELLEQRIGQAKPQAVIEWPPRPAALRHALGRALSAAQPGRAARHQQRPAAALLGVSAAVREILETVRRVAPTRMPVLILGETGTGKELVARAIHGHSERSAGPFVAVNCGAFPESLLDAELFGYRRGAFTGANRDRIGLFEQAHGGTLFLDEIGDTSLAMQVKLLRAIEAGEVRPLGGTDTRTVDVRIVSATHRDVESLMKEGTFREDLYYRLNTSTLYVPPLRRRRVDIPFLAQHFAEEFGASQARRVVLSEDFLEAISRAEFPGNVRELRGAVERAITLATPEGLVKAEALDLPTAAAPPSRGGSLRERVEMLELAAIREALAEHDGNRTRAAATLGLSRLGLRKKMSRLGLE
jgi:DNA-binding NtrC family response regulator